MSQAKMKNRFPALRCFVALASVGLIVSISPLHTSAKAGKCEAPRDAFRRFIPAAVAAPAPETVFFRGDGSETTLADYRGRRLVLNFWATWCLPCVREMPHLDRLKGLLAEHGIDVIAVSEDSEGVPVIKKFYAINKLDQLVVLFDKHMKLFESLKGRGLPMTILIDAVGREVVRVEGAAEWDQPQIVNFIRKCLAPDN